MFIANLLYILLLQLNLYGFGRPSPSFLAVPKSAIVSVSKNVSLECGVYSTQPVAWDFINVSGPSENSVFFNSRITGPWKSRYRINSERTGHFDLVLDSVDHEHAGRYTCKGSSSDSKATAELTVIGSDPVCGMNVTTTATDHIVSLWCEINSTGNLIPSMKWTKDNDAIENNTTQSTTINGLTTTTSFVRLQLQPQDNNTIERITVKCTTSFIWKNGSTVPHYEHVWDHTVTLPYGVRNITIHPNTSGFQIGDQLLCYADGNPQPSYTWTHLNTSCIQTGSVLTLNDSSLSIGSMHVFVCTAENTVAGERKIISKTISLWIGDMEDSVEARVSTTCAAVNQKDQVTTDSSPRQLEVWIIAVGGFSIVIIILIILCLVFQRRKKKGSSKNSSSQSTSNPDVLHHDSLPPNGSNSRNAEKSATAPVHYDADIYAKVNKEPKKKEPKKHTETKSSSNTAQNKGQAGIVGADGTVYMDFSGAKQTEVKKAKSKSPQKVQSKSPQFSQVELYACVDHTLFAPPHPPNSVNAPNGNKSSMH